jgi:hypothetical protein
MTRVAIISLYMLRKGYMKHRIALFIVLMSLLGGIDLYFNQVYSRSVALTPRLPPSMGVTTRQRMSAFSRLS